MWHISAIPQADPMRMKQFPEWPFQQIYADFFELHSHTYSIIAEHYSGWITIYHFKRVEATTKRISESC